MPSATTSHCPATATATASRSGSRAPLWPPTCPCRRSAYVSADGIADQTTPSAATSGRPDWSPAARSRRTATALAEHARHACSTATTTKPAHNSSAVGELLDAVAQTSPAATRTETRRARSLLRARHPQPRPRRARRPRAIRSAARGIIQAGSALGRGEDGGTTAMLLSTLVLVALAAARWHSARGHAQQAAAARQTAEHLRTAYHQAAATPMQALRDQGRRPARSRNATPTRPPSAAALASKTVHQQASHRDLRRPRRHPGPGRAGRP